MAYRILEYSIEIIRSRLQHSHKNQIEENNKDKSLYMKFPRVIPIVLYTGIQKWTAKKNFQEMQVEFNHLRGIDAITGYNLIDIRDKNNAIKDNSLISKISVMERMEDSNEMIEMLEQIEKTSTEKEERKFLANILKYLLNDRLNEQMLNVIRKLEMKGEEEKMRFLEILKKDLDEARKKAIKEGKNQGIEEGRKEGIEKGRQEGIERGRQEGIEKGRQEARKEAIFEGMMNVAKRMLAEGVDIDFISKMTGIDKNKLVK